MTPDFALSLSYGGISLLRRASSLGVSEEGWYALGEVALDVDDLSGALEVLREEAVPNADIEGPEVKLVLPNEQIKYIDIPFDPSNGDPTDAVRTALVGATPYEVDDLIFDWRLSDGTLQIAAVARETLAEAEAFAVENMFLPLGFAAIPPIGRFDGEPFFGATNAAATHLAPGVSVLGDDTPIDILDGPVPGSDTVAIDAPENEIDSVADAYTASVEETLAAAMQGHPQKSAPEQTEDAGESAPDDTDDKSPDGDVGFVAQTPAADTAPEPEPEPEPAAPSFAETLAATPPHDAVNDSAEVSAPTLALPDEAPEATKPVAAPVDGADTDGSAGVSFASLRADRTDEGIAQQPVAKLDPTVEGKAPSLSAVRPDAEGSAKGETGSVAARLQAAATASLTAATSEPAQQDRATSQTDDASSVGSVLARAQSGLGRGIGFVSRRTAEIRAARNAPQPASNTEAPRRGAAAALTAGNRMDEAQRMTTFGARRNARVEVGGKPRFLGLMLTAALIVVLLGVAAWASIFVDEGLSRFFPGRDTDGPQTEVAEPGSDPADRQQSAPSNVATTAPTLALPEAGEAQNGGRVASLTPGLPALSGDADLPGDTLGLTRPLGYEALTPEEAEARYAATGIWQRAPLPPAELRQGVLDDLYIASIDPEVVQQDAVALPPANALLADPGISEQGLPPTADQRFTFDDRGLIVPTPEGVEAPGGYLLLSGRPEIEPPVRPALATPQAETARVDPDDAAGPQTDAAADDTATVDVTPQDTAPAPPVVVDPTLRGLRPQVRPEDLAELTERATLGGLSLAELSQLRPRNRPLVVERQALLRAEEERAAEAARLAEAEAERIAAEVAAAVAEEQQNVQTPTSALAVAASAMPRGRPNSIQRIVRQATRQSEQQGTRVASLAPRTVQPVAPSRNSVARAATQRNAINLRRLNLIGVYGKPSDRRALVRLGNGRFKKVKVGDRIDGGRILGISDSQLRYQKGGRNLTLNLPQS